MSREERSDRGRALCETLVARLRDEHGDEPIKWAWEDHAALAVVDRPGVDFVVALFAWEADPTPYAHRTVVQAYGALIAAWAQAVKLYHTRGVTR